MNTPQANKSYGRQFAILVLGCLNDVPKAVIAADVAVNREEAESTRQSIESVEKNLKEFLSLGIISDEGDSPQTQAGHASAAFPASSMTE